MHLHGANLVPGWSAVSTFKSVYLWQNQRVNFKSNGMSLEFAYKVTYKKNVSAYFSWVLKLEYMFQKISRYLVKNENCL